MANTTRIEFPALIHLCSSRVPSSKVCALHSHNVSFPVLDMSGHGLTLIAPLPVNDDDKLGTVQFHIDKQPRSRSRLDALLREGKTTRRRSSARFSVASDDTTEATDFSSNEGDDSSTLLTYGNDSCTTSTSARIEKEGAVSFFLSELSSVFAEPFSNESLMEQGYDYRDEQTVESSEETIESAEETVYTKDDDGEGKNSLNLKAIPVKKNNSDLSAILGKYDRSNSNVSKSSSQEKEEPTERDEPEEKPAKIDKEKPKNIDNDPTMREEDNKSFEENEDKVVSKKVEKEDHDNDDDDYSLNFRTIPTKAKRSDLSTLVAKLERRRSKDGDRQIVLEESRDVDVTEDKTVISHTRITIESTDEVESPTEPDVVSNIPQELPSRENVSSDEAMQPHETAEEEHKNVELTGPEGIVDETQDAEISGNDSLSLSGAEYRGFACFALLGLCAATNTAGGGVQCAQPPLCGLQGPEIETSCHRALLVLDEDDKDIDIPSIECILEEASGTRMCMPKKRQRVKVRAFRGNATDKKSGLVQKILKLTRKKTSSSSIQL